jgi:hypothetical protein
MKQNESLWLGVGVGCALLLLCTLCILGAAAAFLMRSQALVQGMQNPPFEPAPLPPTDPTTSPTQPPMVGPAQPAIPTMPSDLRHVRATITEVTGLSDVATGATCTAEVSRNDRADGTFWCNAQIRCGERLVYGGPDAGFFECVLYGGDQRDVVGSDQRTTSEDNDGAMSLNTVDGSFEVWDDATSTLGAFRIRARIDGIE